MSRIMPSMSWRRFKRETKEEEGKYYVVDDVGVFDFG